MKNFILLAALSILTFFSCKNKERTPLAIFGQVAVYGTSEPVDAAQLIITGLDSYQQTLFEDTVSTDPNGRYHAEWETELPVSKISIQALKEGYFSKMLTNLNPDNQPVNFTLDAQGSVRIEAIPDFDGGSVAFSGSFIDTTGWTVHVFDTPQSWVFTTRGNRMHTITYKIWDDGYVVRTDSFYIHGGDTATYRIHF